MQCPCPISKFSNFDQYLFRPCYAGHRLPLLATMQVIYHLLFMNSQLIQLRPIHIQINLYNGTFLLLTFKLHFVLENCNAVLSLLYLHSRLLQSLCQLCLSLHLYQRPDLSLLFIFCRLVQ